MPEHMVILWLDGDADPESVDWEGVTKERDLIITHQAIKTFPWSDVYHEINWWITRPMTLDEWIELDHRESGVLSEILGDNFMGTAGPIPFPEKETEDTG